MEYEYISTQYNMSIRKEPNVNNSAIGSLPKNVIGRGDEVYTTPTGDKWIKILKGGNVVGWVTAIHLGKVYGTITKVDNTPDPDPVPAAGFPDSFIQINNDPNHPDFGKRAEYVFVKVLE